MTLSKTKHEIILFIKQLGKKLGNLANKKEESNRSQMIIKSRIQSRRRCAGLKLNNLLNSQYKVYRNI